MNDWFKRNAGTTGIVAFFVLVAIELVVGKTIETLAIAAYEVVFGDQAAPAPPAPAPPALPPEIATLPSSPPASKPPEEDKARERLLDKIKRLEHVRDSNNEILTAVCVAGFRTAVEYQFTLLELIGQNLNLGLWAARPEDRFSRDIESTIKKLQDDITRSSHPLYEAVAAVANRERTQYGPAGPPTMSASGRAVIEERRKPFCDLFAKGVAYVEEQLRAHKRML